jgi:diadenosine tetraphosphate (Ap4A) HIT family hydrolase
MKEFEAGIKVAFGADLFNWACLMNNAFKTPHPQPHVHWHVWPRYRRPVQIGTHTFTDPNFGHHYDKHAETLVDSKALELITEQFRNFSTRP